MLVGFTITCLCITQVFIVIESNTNELRKYEYELYGLNRSLGLSAKLSFMDYYLNNGYSFSNYTSVTEFNNVILEEIEKSGLEEIYPESSVNFKVGLFSTEIDDDFYPGLMISVVPEFVFQYITPHAFWENSSISKSELAVLYVDSNTLTSYDEWEVDYSKLLGISSFYLAIENNELLYSIPTLINVSHKIIYEYFEESEFSLNFADYIASTDSGLIITESVFQKLLLSVNATSYAEDLVGSRVLVNAQVICDRSKREYSSEEITRTQALNIEIGLNLIQKISTLTEIKIGQTSNYDFFLTILKVQEIRLAMLSIPILVLLGVLTYYGNVIFNLQDKNTLVFFKTNGISRKQITLSNLLIVTSIAILGFFIGLGLVIPFVSAFYNNTLFYSNAQNPVNVIISGDNFLKSTVVFFSIFLLINIPYLLFQIKETNSSSNQKAMNKKIKKAFTIGLVSISLIAIIAAITLFSFLYNKGIYFLSPIGRYVMFAITLIALFSLMITSVRFIPLLVEVLSRKLWKKKQSLFVFALRNLARDKKAMKSGIVIFSSCICVIFLAMNLSFGILITKNHDTKYSIGADARIDLSSDANISLISQSLPSSISFTEVSKIDFVFDEANNGIVSFYIINTSSYYKIAYHPSREIGMSSRKAMSKLELTNSCFVDEEKAQELGIQNNQNYTFNLNLGGQNVKQQLTITDSFKAWPFFISKEWTASMFITSIEINTPIKVITSYSTGQFLLNNAPNFLVEKHLLLKFSNSKSDINTLHSLKQELDGIDEIKILKEELRKSVEIPIAKIAINFSFFFGFIALIILAFSLVVFIKRIFIEQKKEIYLYYSLGSIKKQIQKVLFQEIFFLLIITVILGSILGLFLFIFIFPVVIDVRYIGIIGILPSVVTLIFICTIGIVLLVSGILILLSISSNLNRIIKSTRYTGVK